MNNLSQNELKKRQHKKKKNNNNNMIKENKLINKLILNSKLKDTNRTSRVNGGEQRLCKSFTFLSQQVVEGKFAGQLFGGIGGGSTATCVSEPNKPSSVLPASLRAQQSNYLKNLNAFRLKASDSVSSLVVARSKTVSDVAVQTSIISEGNLGWGWNG